MNVVQFSLNFETLKMQTVFSLVGICIFVCISVDVCACVMVCVWVWLCTREWDRSIEREKEREKERKRDKETETERDLYVVVTFNVKQSLKSCIFEGYLFQPFIWACWEWHAKLLCCLLFLSLMKIPAWWHTWQCWCVKVYGFKFFLMLLF